MTMLPHACRPACASSVAIGAALSASLLVVPLDARAACVPSEPGIRCSGTDTAGVDAPGVRTTVEVARGAAIATTRDAVRLGNEGLVLNRGLIASTQGDAIVGSGDLRVESGDEGDEVAGTIVAAGDAIRAAGDVRVINVLGSIVAGDDAIVAGGNVSVANLFGDIVAGDRAVQAGGAARVEAYGDITAGGVGIEGGDGSSIEVLALDTVEAADDAVRFGRRSRITLDNSGSTIRATGVGATAVSLVDGAIDNYFADIEAPRGVAVDIGFRAQGDQPPGDTFFLNYGDVRGLIGIRTAPGDTASQRITNDGRIVGTSGVAIDLGGGNDVLTQYEYISGDTFFGSGNDMLDFYRNRFAPRDDRGSVFDGGAGFDIVRLSGLTADELIPLPIGYGTVFAFADNPTRAPLTLRGFERLVFEDSTLTGELAPIPLPAGLPLLAAALGALVALRRRGRA